MNKVYRLDHAITATQKDSILTGIQYDGGKCHVKEAELGQCLRLWEYP